MSELYAKLFVSPERPRAGLLALVAEALGGTSCVSTVVASHCEVDVGENDDYSPQALRANPADFVFFPHTVEVFSRGEDPRLDAFLQTVGLLMNRLNAAGMKVVAACDWEDQLPGNGKLGF